MPAPCAVGMSHAGTFTSSPPRGSAAERSRHLSRRQVTTVDPPPPMMHSTATAATQAALDLAGLRVSSTLAATCSGGLKSSRLLPRARHGRQRLSKSLTQGRHGTHVITRKTPPRLTGSPTASQKEADLRCVLHGDQPMPGFSKDPRAAARRFTKY
jgi:hypothetical protein